MSLLFRNPLASSPRNRLSKSIQALPVRELHDPCRQPDACSERRAQGAGRVCLCVRKPSPSYQPLRAGRALPGRSGVTISNPSFPPSVFSRACCAPCLRTLRQSQRASQLETNMTDQDRVFIFDTTLRDGEQSPRRLDDPRGKAGSGANCWTRWASTSWRRASPSPRRAISKSVSEIARRVKNASVAGLCRAQAKDIDRCAEAA